MKGPDRSGRPGHWLRPIALVLVVAAHVGAFVGVTFVHGPNVDSPTDSIEISIAGPVGEEATQTQPEIASAPPPPAQPAPAPTPPDPLPPPDVVSLDPPPPDKPPEIAPPIAEPPASIPLPRVEAPDALAIPEERPPPPPPKITPLSEPPPPPQQAILKPEGIKADQPSAASLSAYQLKLKGAIKARAAGLPSSGSAVVSFVVGASGGMVSALITRSSGSPAFDAAVIRIVRSARPGPPPGGVYAGSVTING